MFYLSIAAAAAAAIAPMRWAPPALTEPTTIVLGKGATVSRLDPAHDYILQMPAEEKKGSTVILGGRNVIIRGGHISMPVDDKVRRAIYIKNTVGTVHLEGLLIDNPAGAEFDAIAIAAPLATVQVERVRVEGLQGSQATFHSDVIQPWGGVKALRVDQLTATSGYQGLQLPDMHGGTQTGPVTLSRVNLRYAEPRGPLAKTAYDGRGGFLLWTVHGRNCAMTVNISLDNVFIEQSPNRRPETAVWPPADGKMACGSRLTADKHAVSFPKLPIEGHVSLGSPPHGDFVPSGSVGVNYRR